MIVVNKISNDGEEKIGLIGPRIELKRIIDPALNYWKPDNDHLIFGLFSY